MEKTTLVIAECGVNHNGSPEVALELVDAAAGAGADVVKFQTFRADALATAQAPRSTYQKRNTGSGASQAEMLRALELSRQDHEELVQASERRGVAFMSSPFDAQSASFLVEELGVAKLKLGSGELTSAPLLLHCARLDVPIVLSTGMATLAEVEEALGVLAFGMLGGGDAEAGRDAFREALTEERGWQLLRERVTLLHCTTNYPAEPEEVNLLAMDTLRSAFGLHVGYSDHTLGSAVALAAVARGAEIIEKHLTLDRAMPGPDHRASMEPEDFRQLVQDIRVLEQALGDGRKRPMPSEKENRGVARKSLVCLRPVRRGEQFTSDNLGIKRPGTGVSPLHYWEYLGRTAERDYGADELIDP